MRTRLALGAAVSTALVAYVAAFAAGCSSAEKPAEQTGSADIINGTASPANEDAVVLLQMDDEVVQGGCTGTLVAPNLVLTARHCVSETSHSGACTQTGVAVEGMKVFGNMDPAKLAVIQGRSLTNQTKISAVGKTLFVEPGSVTCDADVAFVLLDRDVPGPIASIRLTGNPAVDEFVTAVGWGLTEIGDVPNNRMRRKDVKVLAVGPMLLDEESQIGLGPNEYLVGEAFCSGDSGGPALSKTGAVVGVVSRGGGGEQTANRASGCMGAEVIGWYTHIANRKSLVSRAFAAAGHAPRPESDTGLAVGKACKADWECAAGGCEAKTCAKRCDDGSTCGTGEKCTPHAFMKVCVGPATKPPTPAPTPDPANPGTGSSSGSEGTEGTPGDTTTDVSSSLPGTTTTRTTTTSTCGIAPGSTRGSSTTPLAALGAVLALGMLRGRRRALRRGA